MVIAAAPPTEPPTLPLPSLPYMYMGRQGRRFKMARVQFNVDYSVFATCVATCVATSTPPFVRIAGLPAIRLAGRRPP